MAKKSMDFSKLKELMFEKGERFALVAVAVITVLLLFAGIFGPMAPSTSPPANAGGSTWPTAIMTKVKDMSGQIDRSVPGDNDIPKVKKDVDPRAMLAGAVAFLGPRSGFGQFLAFGSRIAASRPATHISDYIIHDNPQFALWGPLFNASIDTPNERVNPTILAMGTKVDGNVREVQVDYFPAPAIVLDADLAKKTFMAVVFNDNKFVPSMLLEPKRMVVISMTFPIKEQLEYYREALRYPTVKQLLEKGEAPRFLGLNIWKQQIGPDGKETKPEPLYQYDEKEEKVMVRSEALDNFFRRMRIDDDNPKQLAAYLGPNMVTPVPALAAVRKGEASYPPPRLTGLPAPPADDPEAAPVVPKKEDGGFGLGKKKDPKAVGPKPGKEVTGLLRDKKFKELPAELQARLNGNYNVFDPYGGSIKTSKDVKDEKKGPMINFGDTFKKGKDEDAKGDEEISRLLARFIDVDAQVGKTYRYWVQVRVASPNFGRTEDVAHLDIGKPSELPSDWATTPWITVPGETNFFAVDQLTLPEKTEAIPAKGGTSGVDKDKVDAEQTVVQLHRWIEKAGDRPVGDWAVAERLAIRRGDIIGRKSVRVEVPEWNAKKGQFELGFAEAKGKVKIPGIPVDFTLGDPAPILVDFQGGKHDYKLGKTNIKEDAAVEMLVLTPEGNLIVRNSRVDSDPTTEIGRFRSQHYWRWRNRVRAVRDMTSGGGSAFPTK